MNYGAFSDTTASPVVMKLQNKLAVKSLFPGVVDGKFDAKLVTAYETYAGGQPTSLKAAAAVIGRLETETPSATASLNLTPEEIGLLSVAYLAFKDVNGGIGYKIRKHMVLVIATGVVLAAGTAGTIWYVKSRKGGGHGTGGLGCPCSAGLGHSFGHGGRTTMYSFPSGKKRGHYSSATKRFHRH